MNSLSPIATSILEELAYFDLFDFPLTPMELWRYSRPAGVTYAELIETLERDPALREKVEEHWGMYMLAGRRAIVRQRLQRYREAENKFQRAVRYVAWLSHFPFVRMVAVCNSLAYSNSRSEADIDVLVITEPGRIWTTRMFATGSMKIFGQRPARAHTRDTLCLSFFLSRDHLDLRPIRLATDDVYFAHWMLQLVPMYDPENIYADLMAVNSWILKRFPNVYGMDTSVSRRVRPSRFARSVQTAMEACHRGSLGNHLEETYERWQRRLLPEPLRTMANRDSRVILSDAMLKFHDHDRREEYRRSWQTKLSELTA